MRREVCPCHQFLQRPLFIWPSSILRPAPPPSSINGGRAGTNGGIPESTLLLLAALGGSVSMLITMKLIRHKTRKAKFMVGIPVILALQLLLAAALLALYKGWL